MKIYLDQISSYLKETANLIKADRKLRIISLEDNSLFYLPTGNASTASLIPRL